MDASDTTMVRLTIPQRVKIIEWWHQTRSVVQIQRNYCKHFEVRNAPERKTIARIVRKFPNLGTVCDLQKGESGRKRTARSEENVVTVREAILRSPRQAVRRLSSETGIKKLSVVIARQGAYVDHVF